MSEATSSKRNEHSQAKDRGRTQKRQYWRFGVMIATSMIFMYGITYLNTYEWAHVDWSETRFFMTLLMGATMTVVMLLFMLGMYKNTKMNVGIIVLSVVVFVLGTFLVRSQTTVDDKSYMRAMIPHHSIAILTSENSEIKDVRTCELAREIIEAQKREIAEMKWLIDDINKNGPAKSQAEARERQVPEFAGLAERNCE